MNEAKRLEILALLQSDGRLSPDQIAAMVGETPDAVSSAITEMEGRRVVLQYTALVDWDKAGDNRVNAVIEVKLTPQRDTGFDRLAERIARFPEVRSCYLMSGTYDLAVEVEAPTLREVARFVAERLSTLDGVASTTTHFVLKRYKHDGVTFFEADDEERLAVAP